MVPDSPTASPSADDFRALARSSPWRFTTLHFTHHPRDDHKRARPAPVEAWLDRSAMTVTVRSTRGVEVVTGAPYTTATVSATSPGGAVDTPPPPRPAGLAFRPDGLLETRPYGWHYDHGDPMWNNYRWTAMLDPSELSEGVDISDVTATMVRGRATWTARCRPLIGEDEDWVGGYDPRCGCCPLLDSLASRLLEYGEDHPELVVPTLPTAYLVQLDVQTGIVVDIAPLDGTEGSSLANEIHAVDGPLQPPTTPPA